MKTTTNGVVISLGYFLLCPRWFPVVRIKRTHVFHLAILLLYPFPAGDPLQNVIRLLICSNSEPGPLAYCSKMVWLLKIRVCIWYIKHTRRLSNVDYRHMINNKFCFINQKLVRRTLLLKYIKCIFVFRSFFFKQEIMPIRWNGLLYMNEYLKNKALLKRDANTLFTLFGLR